MRGIFCLTIFLVAAGCTQIPINAPSATPPLAKSQYVNLVKQNTKSTNQYSGLYQTFQADVTILTSELQSESLKQKAQFQQWDARRYQLEREKMLEENAAFAKFFLRFYTPERDYDDLDKSRSIWKIYIDYNGNRFEGKVSKISDKLVEIQHLYPHMDRFSTPYEISFNVPMATIEQGKIIVTLTSSLGTANFQFSR